MGFHPKSPMNTCCAAIKLAFTHLIYNPVAIFSAFAQLQKCFILLVLHFLLLRKSFLLPIKQKNTICNSYASAAIAKTTVQQHFFAYKMSCGRYKSTYGHSNHTYASYKAIYKHRQASYASSKHTYGYSIAFAQQHKAFMQRSK